MAYGGFQLAEGLTYNPPSEGASYTFKQKEFIDWYQDEYESANEKAVIIKNKIDNINTGNYLLKT